MNTELKRPAKNTGEMIEAAVEMIFPSVWDWLKSAGDSDFSNEEQVNIKKDLRKAIDGCWGDYDGYRIARRLDDSCMWECDAQLVDILDSFWSYIDKVHDVAVQNWVKECGIIPQHSIGDDIEIKIFGKEYSGTIVGVNPLSAKYTVNVPSMGHKKFSLVDGAPVFEPGSDSLGVIIEVETVDGSR
jgi:hypothetical protein